MESYLNFLPEELINIILDEQFDFIIIDTLSKIIKNYDLYKLASIKKFRVFGKYSSNQNINWKNVYYQSVLSDADEFDDLITIIMNTTSLHKIEDFSLIWTISDRPKSYEMTELFDMYFINPNLEVDEENIIKLINNAVSFRNHFRMIYFMRQDLTNNLKDKLFELLIYSNLIGSFPYLLNYYKPTDNFYKNYTGYIGNIDLTIRGVLYENKMIREGFSKYGNDLNKYIRIKSIDDSIHKIIKDEKEFIHHNITFYISISNEFIITKKFIMLYKVIKIDENAKIFYIRDLTKEDIELGKEKGYSI